jgi:peptidoglycan/xylan/chitin deacetylase (PgdA/CDA1 family)
MGPARADDCSGNPNAIGTSRTIAVDPTEHPLVGVLQYKESLPLQDKEVVLTFDDGPLPPYTSRILDVLASECVKATFFMVGRMAHSFPALVKRVHAEGHTIANHSQNHPFTFHKMSVPAATKEIEDGFTSIRNALGDQNGVADFFRIPGLLRQESTERYLAAKGVMTWSVDFVADDWTRISDKEVVRRALNRIEARGKGILLLHDIQPATALGLHTLLRELKARGYKIVHVVQANPDHPKTATLPEQWIGRHEKSVWPKVLTARTDVPARASLEVPSPRNFGVDEETGVYEVVGAVTAIGMEPDRLRAADRDVAISAESIWPEPAAITASASAETEMLPIPGAINFRYRIGRQRNNPQRTLQKPAAAKRDHRTELTTASIPATRAGSAKTAAHTRQQQPAAGEPQALQPPPQQAVGHQFGILTPATDFISRVWR